MINFGLAKEIYGLTPWMMDIHSVPIMTSILSDIKNGVVFDTDHVKLNTPYVYDIKSETRLIQRDYQLNNNDNFEAIGLINLNGPITKSGGSSTIGMEQLSSMMYSMSKDERIKSFLILADSGGGSSSAVQLMVDTINEIKQTKPVYSLITKGSVAASACYGIISASTKIYSEDGMNVVGSIGTMLQFEGKKANTESKDGVINVRLYATKSIKKNGGFEKALNEGNFDVLIDSMLDPINENFISMISSNRPAIKGMNFDDGDVHFSKDVIGTFIDGIASFKEVVNELTNATPTTPKKKEFNTNLNNKKMTKAEFKTANPDAYNEIVAEGIAQRTDQVGAWLAHVNTDAEAVVKGIGSGENITQSQRESFFVKQNSKIKVEALKKESADDLVTDESLTDLEKIANKEKKALIENAFGFDLK